MEDLKEYKILNYKELIKIIRKNYKAYKKLSK